MSHFGENQVVVELEGDPEISARLRAVSDRADLNSKWLEAHWPDLLPAARGKFVAVMGQQAFVSDSAEAAWALARAAHPEEIGGLLQYVQSRMGPRIYANRW